MLLVYEGEQLVAQHELRDEGATCLAGRGEECRIRIDTGSQPLASRTHARFEHSWGGCAVTDTSRNGVWVNGTQVQGTHLLEDGDYVTFAGPDTRHIATRIVFRMLASTADAPDRTPPPPRAAAAPRPAPAPATLAAPTPAPAPTGPAPLFIAPSPLPGGTAAPTHERTAESETGVILERIAIGIGVAAVLVLVVGLLASC